MKRSFLLLLVLAILFTGIAVVQAEDVAATPDAFVRRYSVYLYSQSFTYVMNENNWYNEQTLSVTFESTTGPQLISIWITCTNKTTKQEMTYDMVLSVSQASSISLPWSGNCTFTIYAGSFDVAGNVTLVVSLK